MNPSTSASYATLVYGKNTKNAKKRFAFEKFNLEQKLLQNPRTGWRPPASRARGIAPPWVLPPLLVESWIPIFFEKVVIASYWKKNRRLRRILDGVEKKVGACGAF